MISNLVTQMQRLRGWRLVTLLSILILIAVEIIVSGMSLLLQSAITYDYLITGFVAASLAAPSSLALINHILDSLKQEQLKSLTLDDHRNRLKLEMAVEAAQMDMWELNLATYAIKYNTARIKLPGFADVEPPRNLQAWLACIHPDDVELFQQRIQQALQPGAAHFDFEYRVALNAGTWAWVHTRGGIIQRDVTGKPILAAGSTMNISARKHVEAALIRNQVLLSATLESTDEGVLMVAHDGRVLSTNKRFLELWRIPNDIAAIGHDDLLLNYVLQQLLYPDVFLDLVKSLYDTDKEARDLLHFKDGRVFSRFTKALRIGDELGRIWCFKDITTQYQDEAELKTIKERYDFATQVGHVGTWDWDPATGQLFWSDETFRLMGFEPGTLTPTYELYLGLVHPDDRVRLNSDVQAALENKKPYALDCRIVLRNNREIVCHVTGKVEFDAHNQPIRMLGTIQDITQRKQVESALAESRNLLKTVIDTAPMRVFWKDRELRYLGCNPAFAKDAGKLDAQALIGKTDFDMTWRAQAELYRADDKQVMESGIAKLSYDEPQTTPEGNAIWLRTSKVPLQNASGDTVGILGIYEDITIQKQAQLALIASEQKLLTILDNVDAFIYLKDIDGKYLFANRKVRELWGVTMKEIVGYGDEKFFDAVTTENIRRNDRDVLDRGETHTDEETNTVIATGKTFTYLSTKLPLRHADGSIYALCGVSTDITVRIQTEQALHASEQRAQNLAALLRGITDNVTDMIWAKDLNNHYLFTNNAMCKLLLNAKDTEEPVGKDDMFFALRERKAHPEDMNWHTFGELCQDSDTVTLKNGKASQFDEFGNVKGQFLFLDVHKAPFVNDFGEVIGVVGSGRDVTQQKIIEEKLRLASMVLENSSEAMFVTDGKNNIIEVNPAFTVLTGYPPAEVIGKNPRILHSGKHDAAFYAAMQKELRETGHWQGEIWNRRKNGEIYAEWQTINTVYNADGSIHWLVALFSDVTERKKSEELIWAQANFDPLTGLPNRRMFRDRLTQDIKKAHRAKAGLALMFLDLDHFKEVNDSLGHDQGDALLMEAAHRIVLCVRESDTVARLGGDEFTIILSELEDRSSVERIATDILYSLSQPYELAGNSAYVSASIGITLYPDDATTLEDMLKNADQAMYVAKNAGRNRFSYFTNAMQESALYRLRIMNDLHGALAQQQMQVQYQPIVDIYTGKIHKAEALLRWFHPQRGLISPAEFIPLAEESGLIHAIGDWVFRQVVKQTLKWTADYGEDFQVSMNKSPIQMQSKSELCRWQEYLTATCLPGKNLVIEITEGVLLDRTPAVISELMAFRDAGIQVAIDDFGTGYSALSYLKKLDIDYVKIDQSFIFNLATDDNDKALAEAIVVMAHKLGLKVIAEGVETQEQLNLLAMMGCDYAQGFLYSRALTPEDFERLMKSRQG